MTKIEALAKFLECDANELSEVKHDENTFEYGREEYLVSTDEEADSKAKEYILDSVWAFNASFLAAHCDLDQEVIESIQSNDRCEGNNEVLLRLIKDKDHFVRDAIASDGRGHFMNTYDGEEHEIHYETQRIDKKGIVQTEYNYLYIYRTN